MRFLITGALALVIASHASAANRPSGYVTICKEGVTTCSVSSTTNVAFGRADQFIYKQLSGTFACTEATFGGRIDGGVDECSVPAASASSSTSSAASSKASSSVASSKASSSAAASSASSRASSSAAASSKASSSAAVTLASLGFKGFGTETTAGSGGRIIRVTTLASTGSGSLREALAASGPRIIIFDVGGVIDLNKSDLTINNPYVTIAGQTAPSPGITLIRSGMAINTHDVLMQHIRFRIGDAGMAKGSGFEKDVSVNGKDAYNVVVDHCSFAWGTDENLSVSGPRYDGPSGTSHRVTLSSNIVAEGLYDSTHSKGIHSMGSLIHDNVQDVAVIGSLYAHNNERNPWYKGNATGVIVNNLIYNPGKWAIRMGAIESEWDGYTLPANPRVAIIGNVMHHGANTISGLGLVGSNTTGGDVFMSDNLAYDKTGASVPQTFGTGIKLLSAAPVWPTGLTSLSSSAVTDQVLNHAGARPKDRDAVDTRIVNGFKQRTGTFVNSQNEVGGYPTATQTNRVLTVPSSGVDAWLQQLAKELE